MSILDRKRFGLVLRVFSNTPEQVEKNVLQVKETTQRALGLQVNNRDFFNRVLILVAADPRHIDCDCGETKARLLKEFPFGHRVEVHEIKKGDLFCGTLNHASAHLSRLGIDYMGILSHEARDYLREDVVLQMVDAFERGAKVSGVALKELSQSILEGRIANTFAFWEMIPLIEVGGFDLRAAQARKDDPTTPHLRGWNAEKGEVFYPAGGVEEVIPLLRLARLYGACIAPVVPAGEGKWEPPTDAEGLARFQRKMGTKLQRQMAHAVTERSDLDALKGAVMPDYRQF